MLGRIVKTISGDSGQVFDVRNHSASAVTYCVEFVGIGRVRFSVLPGGSFDVIPVGGVVNIHIEDIAPSGISLA